MTSDVEEPSTYVDPPIPVATPKCQMHKQKKPWIVSPIYLITQAWERLSDSRQQHILQLLFLVRTMWLTYSTSVLT